MRVLVVNHVSLDGVLQGPGRPDEDTRDGFRHGGWAAQQANDPHHHCPRLHRGAHRRHRGGR